MAAAEVEEERKQEPEDKASQALTAEQQRRYDQLRKHFVLERPPEQRADARLRRVGKPRPPLLLTLVDDRDTSRRALRRLQSLHHACWFRTVLDLLDQILHWQSRNGNGGAVPPLLRAMADPEVHENVVIDLTGDDEDTSLPIAEEFGSFLRSLPWPAHP